MAAPLPWGSDNTWSGCYFTRKEIEENSPSRRDGIDLKKETCFRKSYAKFLKDLGKRLKIPQLTIATAVVFCHRFFLCQSHAKNDRKTIAAVCMFLACKVEETLHALKDVIIVAYEMIHKKDLSAAERIRQKEVYEKQRELVLHGERLVLVALNFDLNVQHPYTPLVHAIKKLKVTQNAVAQIAWNFLNDGLSTSLWLQFKPHHIAVGAIFLAAEFIKAKLPTDGDRAWWQEFDVTSWQLEEISNQMMELYHHTRAQPSNLDGNNVSMNGSFNKPAGLSMTVDHRKSANIEPEAVEPLSVKKDALHHNGTKNKDRILKEAMVVPCGSEITTEVASSVCCLDRPEIGLAMDVDSSYSEVTNLSRTAGDFIGKSKIRLVIRKAGDKNNAIQKELMNGDATLERDHAGMVDSLIMNNTKVKQHGRHGLSKSISKHKLHTRISRCDNGDGSSLKHGSTKRKQPEDMNQHGFSRLLEEVRCIPIECHGFGGGGFQWGSSFGESFFSG